MSWVNPSRVIEEDPYIDWIIHRRLRSTLLRETGAIEFSVKVEQSETMAVPQWSTFDYAKPNMEVPPWVFSNHQLWQTTSSWSRTSFKWSNRCANLMVSKMKTTLDQFLEDLRHIQGMKGPKMRFALVFFPFQCEEGPKGGQVPCPKGWSSNRQSWSGSSWYATFLQRETPCSEVVFPSTSN